MKKVLTFLAGLFKDEPGSPSMKRVCGLICVLVLCATMYSFSIWLPWFNCCREDICKKRRKN